MHYVKMHMLRLKMYRKYKMHTTSQGVDSAKQVGVVEYQEEDLES